MAPLGSEVEPQAKHESCVVEIFYCVPDTHAAAYALARFTH